MHFFILRLAVFCFSCAWQHNISKSVLVQKLGLIDHKPVFSARVLLAIPKKLGSVQVSETRLMFTCEKNTLRILQKPNHSSEYKKNTWFI